MDLFPHIAIRDGQRELLKDCETALSSGRSLIAHAPTGIGKTAAVLPAAISHAAARGKRVFFLTPKHTQHTIAVETIKRICRKHDADIRVADIIGKQWMCPQRVKDLTSREFNHLCRAQKRDELCEYYNNTRKAKLSRKARDAVASVLATPMHNESVVSLCAPGKLCPYEVLLEAGRKADVIVCDYFHIFSPGVRDALFAKLDIDISDAVLIVDEAHNLPERIRSLMSSSMSEYTLDRASSEAKALNFRGLAKSLSDISLIIRALSKGVKRGGETYVGKRDLMDCIEERTRIPYEDLKDDMEALGREILKLPKRYRSHSQATARFLKRWEGPELGFARIAVRGERNCSLYHKCLDPSLFSASVFSEADSAILMSGTLTPTNMYADVLGLASHDPMERAYRSPFPEENRLSLLVPGLTTKYSLRTPEMYMRYSDTISKLLSLIPGNVAVFFPSYRLAADISAKVTTDKQTFSESQDMKKPERRRIFDSIVEVHRDSVLFGVQAGSFSEGLDYANNLLSGVIIVGLPLERPNLETQALIDYYDFKFERGFDYGYTFPAMNRTLQAAGRCIRSETDRGAIILLDERFRWANYRRCFPSDFDFLITEEPGKHLARFFSE